jgi:hypothetical protein
MSAARPTVAAGRTRTCPHCKATILESASVCPKCQHHLRFDSEAQKGPAARSAFKVEGKVQHPANEDPWEYCVVVSVRNEKGEEVARNVVNVGALQGTEVRTFALSVDVMPPKGLRAPQRNG